MKKTDHGDGGGRARKLSQGECSRGRQKKGMVISVGPNQMYRVEAKGQKEAPGDAPP